MFKFINIIVGLIIIGFDNFFEVNISEKKVFYIINALNLNLQTEIQVQHEMTFIISGTIKKLGL